MPKTILGWFSGIQEYVWIGIAAILLSGVVWGVLEHRKVSVLQAHEKALSEALDASEASNAILKQARVSDNVAATAKANATNANAAKEANTNAKISKALAAHRDWASEPVPADVVTGLRP